jgi:hypothetical protein
VEDWNWGVCVWVVAVAVPALVPHSEEDTSGDDENTNSGGLLVSLFSAQSAECL